MDQDLIKLILDVTDSGTIDEATGKLQKMKMATTELAGSQGALKTTVESTTSAHGDMGRGVLQASYAVQDFTSVLQGGGGLSRALGSVQNNIPVLLTSLGMGAGLAGTVSLVTVGLGAVIPLLASFTEGSKEAAEAAKKLAEESEKLKNTLTTPQEDTKKAVDAYLKESPERVIEQGIQAALRAQRRQGLRENNINEEMIARVLEMEDEKLTRRGQDIFTGLSTDPGDRDAAIAMAKQFPGNFPGGFKGAMEAANEGKLLSPAEKKARLKRWKDRQKQEDKEIVEAAEREDKEIDALNEQGRQIEKKMFEDRDRDRDRETEHLTEEGRRIEARMWREKEADDDRTNEKRKRDAERDRKKREHDRDPSNRLSARIKAREDAATVEAQRQNQMRQQAGAAPFSDAQLRSIASEAASFPGDLSRNIDAAMGQAMQKIMEMRMHAQQANARLNQWGQQFQALPQMGESRLP